MTFEEDFPEFEEYNKTDRAISIIGWDDIVKEAITKHCISKQRLQKIIDEVIPENPKDAQGILLRAEFEKRINKR